MNKGTACNAPCMMEKRNMQRTDTGKNEMIRRRSTAILFKRKSENIVTPAKNVAPPMNRTDQWAMVNWVPTDPATPITNP